MKSPLWQVSKKGKSRWLFLGSKANLTANLGMFAIKKTKPINYGARMAQNYKQLDDNELAELFDLHALFLLNKPEGRRLSLTIVDFSKIVWQNRDLSDAQIIGCNFSGAKFVNCRFDRADLSQCNFQSADFRRASLRFAVLRGANLINADLSMADLTCADLRENHQVEMRSSNKLQIIRHEARASSAVNALFNGATMDNSRLDKMDLGGANFKDSSLKGASLEKTVLTNCDFTGANLAGARLVEAQLGGAIFHEAILTGAEFGKVAVQGEKFRGAVLSLSATEQEQASTLKSMAKAHELWWQTNGKSGKPANFDDTDLRPMGNDFVQMRLTALSAKNCIATGLLFHDTQLQGANFEGADLRGASFANADLRGANFKGARLVKCDFTAANLGPLPVSPASPKYADFSNSDLRYAKFDDANLLNALFHGADTSETSFKNASIMAPKNAPTAFVA